MISVFLGGTCNDSTWRDELLSMIDINKVNCFNPVVDDWNEDAQRNEDWHKIHDDFCVYVITPEMTGIYSIFELATDSYRRSNKTIFCVLYERNNAGFPNFMKKNFEKIKQDVIQNGSIVFDSLEEIATFLNNYEQKNDYPKVKRKQNKY